LTSASIDSSVIDRLRDHPSVTHIDRLRQFFAYTNGRRFSLAGVDTEVPPERPRFALIEGEVDGLPRDAVLVGEPLARKEGVGVGDELVVDGPDGPVRLPIAGVYYDYSGEMGSAFLRLDTMAREFGDGPIGGVALYLEPGADADDVVDELKQSFAGTPLNFRSNRGLRERAMQVFDQTFAITRLLRYMSLLIAVSGVALTLIVLARERASELALYRALGASRAQIFRIYLGKGLGMGAAGIALGSAAGVAFALILVFVVNRAFFGWTIALHWPGWTLAWQSAIVLAASAFASVYPAVVASKTPATVLRREDL
jgi:putative ABC transport system permease protein